MFIQEWFKFFVDYTTNYRNRAMQYTNASHGLPSSPGELDLTYLILFGSIHGVWALLMIVRIVVDVDAIFFMGYRSSDQLLISKISIILSIVMLIVQLYYVRPRTLALLTVAFGLPFALFLGLFFVTPIILEGVVELVVASDTVVGVLLFVLSWRFGAMGIYGLTVLVHDFMIRVRFVHRVFAML